MKQIYKLFLITLACQFLFRIGLGQVTVAVQDFETIPATPTWNITAGGGNIGTAAGGGDTPATQRIRGGARSWQVNNGTATLDLDTFNVSSYSNIAVYVRISSTSTTTGNGADAGDYLRVFAALDNAAFLTNTQANADIAVNGDNNARWSYNNAENATTTAGTNLVVAGTSGTNAGTIYSTLKINIPNGTNNVKLRIIALNNATQEVWNVDDITIVAGCNSAPTTQATNISFSSVTTTSMTVGWTSGNGNRRILVGRQGGPVSWTPTNGTPPSGVNANFTSATDQGSGNKILYSGTGNSINITNLTANTFYYFRVYEFCDATNQYLTSAGTNNDGNQNQQTNCNAEPTTQASSISFGTTGPTSMVINWTNGNGRKRIVVLRASASVSWTPTDGSAPTGVNSVFSSATDKGSGNKIVYNGTGNTVTVTGLTANTTYYVQVFEFCDGNNDYLITSVPTNNGTQSNTTSNAGAPTILYMGDLALVALDANYTYNLDNTCDKISFVNFVELNPGTEILFTDNGYERGAAANVQTRRHGGGEGVVKLTWNGSSPLAKGTVTEWKPCESNTPTPDWTYTDIKNGTTFDLANAGDELFIMQGTWNTSRDSLEGRYIFAGSTWDDWLPVSSAVPDRASGTGQSRLPEGLECLNLQVNFIGGGEGRYKATETYTGTQMALLGYVVNDNTRWDAGAGKYSKPADFTVTGLGGVIGNWNGGTDTRWFNGCNWDVYRVPDSTVNVTFSVSNVVNANSIVLLPNETAKCNDLTISGGNGINSTRRIVGKSSANRVLSIYGDLTFNGQNALDFDDGNNGTSDGTIKLKGNWVNQGSETDFIEGNSTIVFDGYSTQTISVATGDNEYFYNLVFNNNAGFSLSDSISVSGTLALTRGVVNTNGKTVSVTNPSETSITDGNSVVSYASSSSWVNGNLNRSISNTGVFYMYPVGSASKYQLAGIKINSHTGLSRINMFFTSGSPGAATLASPFAEGGAYFTKLLQDGKWTTSANAGVSSINYNLELFPSFDWGNSCGSGLPCAAYTIVKRPNDSSPWDNGTSAPSFTGGYAGSGRNNVSGGILRTGYTSFSEEGIAGSEDSPFPIELLSFNGLYIGNHTASLSWQTTPQSTAKIFYIEKATDATNFVMIGYVASNASNSYNFKDFNMLDSRVFYRLRMIDNDGSFTLSPVVELTQSSLEETAYIFPNPSKPGASLNLFVRVAQSQTANVEIYNTLGQIVDNQDINIKSGSGNYVLHTDLSGGIYCVKISGKGFETTQRIVVE
ncbi:MAG: T9SS type A sorting domain-containing protein [Bacteroidia bacterium]|nr:T9SS type A sorting domain-containing protein [Bacteroidia bacterium]